MLCSAPVASATLVHDHLGGRPTTVLDNSDFTIGLRSAIGAIQISAIAILCDVRYAIGRARRAQPRASYVTVSWLDAPLGGLDEWGDHLRR